VLLDWFEGLAPTDIGYQNLSAGYVRYRRLAAQGGWPAFPAGPTIEPNMSDRRIPALIDRLTAEGDLSAADGARLKAQGLTYGYELQQALQGFQVRHGLAPTPGSARAPSGRCQPRPRIAPARSR
jgi:L,D-transpeptidase YcbB